MTAQPHGIDLEAFRFREAKKALASAIFYARAQAFNLYPTHWDSASDELRDKYLAFAEAVLKLPDVPMPAPPEKTTMDYRGLMVGLTRHYASGLRPTHGPVIGAIEPVEGK